MKAEREGCRSRFRFIFHKHFQFNHLCQISESPKSGQKRKNPIKPAQKSDKAAGKRWKQRGLLDPFHSIWYFHCMVKRPGKVKQIDDRDFSQPAEWVRKLAEESTAFDVMRVSRQG